MPEFQRQSLRAAIDASRSARDTFARTAGQLRESGAIRLADALDGAAAVEDKFLAQLLAEDSKLQYRAGAIHPQTPGDTPAK